MDIKLNIYSNYAGLGIVGLAPIIALPWYLEALGPSLFGLISFALLVQALLGMLDTGLSQALVREFAVRQGATEEDRYSTSGLLYSFERIYWWVGFALAAITALLAGPIASYWLNTNDLPSNLGVIAVVGGAALFFVQFPGSVYRSALVGSQSQVTLNLLSSSAALIKHFGGVLLVFAWPNLSTFFFWHVAIGFGETVLRAFLAWSKSEVARNEVRWDHNAVVSARKWGFGLSGAALIGALTVQTDRIFLSYAVPIEELGYYSIAATIAAGALQLIYPLVQAVLPRAVQLRADFLAVRRLELKLAGAITAVVVSSAIGFALMGKWILSKWLHNPQAEMMVYPILTVLLLGSAVNAFYNIGYLHWVVHAKVGQIFKVNVLSLLAAVILMPVMVSHYGTVGAAIAWLSINLTGFLMSVGWIKKSM